MRIPEVKKGQKTVLWNGKRNDEGMAGQPMRHSHET